MLFVAISSNYYFYFLLWLLIIKVVADFFIEPPAFKNADKLKAFKINIAAAGFTLLFVFLALFPIIFANIKHMYTDKGTKNNYEVVNNSWQINDYSDINFSKNYVLKRNIEDFFYFTGRPWYFIMPGKSHLYLGDLSEKIENSMKKVGGLHWLAQNYFEPEHTAMFLGFTNIIVAIIGLFAVLLHKIVLPLEKKYKIILVSIMGIVVAVLIMPPFITIHGKKVYLASYILYKLFPMFRSLTRAGVVILLTLLIWTGYGYRYIFMKVNKKIFAYIIILMLFGVSIFEFVVPKPVVDTINVPSEYIELRDNTSSDSRIVIYPYDFYFFRAYRFWLKDHQRHLINPDSYKNAKYGFSSFEFTNNLSSVNGLREAKNLGANYLFVNSNIASSNDIKFFEAQESLEKIFNKNGYILYKIK